MDTGPRIQLPSLEDVCFLSEQYLEHDVCIQDAVRESKFTSEQFTRYYAVQLTVNNSVHQRYGEDIQTYFSRMDQARSAAIAKVAKFMGVPEEEMATDYWTVVENKNTVPKA